MTRPASLAVGVALALLGGCRTREAIPPARSRQQRVLHAYATVETSCKLATAPEAPARNAAPLEIGSYRLRLGDTIEFDELTIDYAFHFLPHGHGRPHGHWRPALVGTVKPPDAQAPHHAFSWMLEYSYEGVRRRHARERARIEVGPFLITALAEGAQHALVRVFLRPGVCDGPAPPDWGPPPA